MKNWLLLHIMLLGCIFFYTKMNYFDNIFILVAAHDFHRFTFVIIGLLEISGTLVFSLIEFDFI